MVNARLKEIHDEIMDLVQRKDELIEERQALVLADARKTYDCTCVKLNRDISVNDMAQQEKAGRRGLGLGPVCETLSSDKKCPTCGGTGRTKRET